MRTAPQKPWTPPQMKRLEEMHGAGAAWVDIAVACNHSKGSCQTTLSRIRRDRIVAEGLASQGISTPAKPLRRFWTGHDVAELIRLRETEKMVWADIDRALGRAQGASACKFETLRRGVKEQVSKLGGGSRIDSLAAERDRDARKHLEHPTLTAAFFGDPLPGRSALDQKRGIGA